MMSMTVGMGMQCDARSFPFFFRHFRSLSLIRYACFLSCPPLYLINGLVHIAGHYIHIQANITVLLRLMFGGDAKGIVLDFKSTFNPCACNFDPDRDIN